MAAENKENAINSEEFNKNDNNPLSVRVDPYFKEVFNKLIKEKGISKKQLLESMIMDYTQEGEEQEREEHISFAGEINLISSGLNDIFSIFKNISVKSQDTVASLKSLYNQKEQNLKTQIETLSSKVAELQEKNKLYESSNKGYALEKESLSEDLKKLKEREYSLEKDISSLNKRNIELLEQLNSLRNLEKENHILTKDTERFQQEIKRLKALVEDKKFDNERLEKRLSQLDDNIKDINDRKSDELRELEYRLSKEAELDRKTAVLELQMRYNELQGENIKNLGIINQKSEEISSLKSRLEEATNDLDKYRNNDPQNN